jgi:hypothetical protein
MRAMSATSERRVRRSWFIRVDKAL